MKQDEEETIVIFRKDKHGVYALFPETPGAPGYVSTYQSTGQHSDASYYYCIENSKPAKEEEYQSLKDELEQIGYKLKIRKRRSRNSIRGENY